MATKSLIKIGHKITPCIHHYYYFILQITNHHAIRGGKNQKTLSYSFKLLFKCLIVMFSSSNRSFHHENTSGIVAKNNLEI